MCAWFRVSVSTLAHCTIFIRTLLAPTLSPFRFLSLCLPFSLYFSLCTALQPTLSAFLVPSHFNPLSSRIFLSFWSLISIHFLHLYALFNQSLYRFWSFSSLHTLSISPPSTPFSLSFLSFFSAASYFFVSLRLSSNLPPSFSLSWQTWLCALRKSGRGLAWRQVAQWNNAWLAWGGASQRQRARWLVGGAWDRVDLCWRRSRSDEIARGKYRAQRR